MTHLFICEECRSFMCQIVDKQEKMTFKTYTLECPLKIKEYGFFVIDIDFHMYDQIGRKDFDIQV